jgi:hypothetical protein
MPKVYIFVLRSLLRLSARDFQVLFAEEKEDDCHITNDSDNDRCQKA